MFYEEKAISEFLICQCCKRVFNDPRLLDCGDSMCNECILSSLSEEKNGLNCPICKNFHEIPENGFRKNKVLANLIQVKPTEVYRGPIANELKSKLKKIREQLETFEIDWKMGKNRITEYCNLVRNNVNDVTESWHQNIDKFNNEFMASIKEYEEKCLKHYENCIDNKKYYNDFFIKNEKFYQKWSDYLNKFNLEEADLTKASSEANVVLANIEDRKEKYKFQIFNGKFLKFVKAENPAQSCMLGEIKFDNIGNVSEKLSSLNLASKLIDLDVKIAIEPLKTRDCFVIAYLTLNGEICIFIVDREGNILKEKKISSASNRFKKSYTEENLKKTFNLNSIDDIKLLNTSECIFLYRHFYSLSTQTWILNLKSFNENLGLIKQINLDCPFTDLACDEKNLFGLTYEMGSHGLMLIYDANLDNPEKIKKNGNSYFFPPKISKFKVNEEYFFLLDNLNQMTLIQRNGLAIVRKFELSSNNFFLSDQNIVYVKAKKLFMLDYQGNIESQHLLDKNIAKMELFGLFNKELIFFDHKKLTFIFKNISK